MKGWAVIIKLWQYIAAHGFYLNWDIDAQLLFIRECQLKTVGQSFVSEVVACGIRRGVFNQEMYEKYRILTSRWLQETFLNATKRNKEVIIEKRYALPIVYEFIENVNESGKNVNIFFKNADISQQKKRKEKKRESTSNEVLKVSKKESNIKESSSLSYARESYDEIMKRWEVSDVVRAALVEFIKHCSLA